MLYYNPVNWAKPVTNTNDVNSTAKEPSESQLSVAADNEVIPIIYGMARVGPKLAKVTTYGSELVMLGIWSHGEIDSYVKFYIDDEESPNLAAFTADSRKGGADNATIPSILTSAIVGYADYLAQVPAVSGAPGVAYSAIHTSAGENTKFPRVTALIKGVKVHDPRLGSDRSVKAWSDNPALCLADFLSNPYYGMGLTLNWDSVEEVADFNDTNIASGANVFKHITQLNSSGAANTATLTIKNHGVVSGTTVYFTAGTGIEAYIPSGTYTATVLNSDTLTIPYTTSETNLSSTNSGSTISYWSEKSRTLNLSLDQMQNATQWVETLRTYASCWVVQIGGEVYLVADKAGASIRSFLHENGDIVNISNVTKRGHIDTPNHMTVSYTDTSPEPKPYKSSPVTAVTAGFATEAIRPSNVSLPGINRHSQAKREAIERLNKLTLNDLSFDLEVFDEGLKYTAGDIVGVKFTEYGISSEGNTPKLMRVMGVKSGSPGRYTLSLVEYDPAVYNNEVAVGPTWNDTSLPDPSVKPNTVTNLQSYEDVYKLKDGTIASRFYISWNAATDMWPLDYNIVLSEYSDAGYNTLVRAETLYAPSGNTLMTGSVVGGNYYKIQVDTVRRSFGVKSTESGGTVTTSTVGNVVTYTSTGNFLSMQALGKTLKPDSIPNESFNYSVSPVTGLSLNWDPVVEIDLAGYQIKSGSWGGSVVTSVGANVNSVILGFTPPGTTTYFIKPYDSSTNEAVTAAQKEVTVTTCSPVVLTPSIVETDFILDWDTPASTWPVKHYTVKYNGTTWNDASTLSAALGVTILKIPANWLGDRIFRVKALDASNTYSAETTATVNISAPATVTLTDGGIFNNKIKLTWTDAGTTLPISYYQIRKGGTTWDDATIVVNSTKELFCVIDPHAAAVVTYRLKAFDRMGNASAESTRNITISAPTDPILVYGGVVGDKARLTWGDAKTTLDIAYYTIRRGGSSWTVGYSNEVLKTTEFLADLTPQAAGVETTYRIRATDVAGNLGAESIELVTINPPATPVLTFNGIVDDKIKISWTDAKTDLTISKYTIERGGTTWGGITMVASTIESSAILPSHISSVAAVQYRIKVWDVRNNVSVSHGSVDITVNPPAIPVVSNQSFANNKVKLAWTDAKTDLSILHYIISVEGTPVLTTKELFALIDPEAVTSVYPALSTNTTYVVKAYDISTGVSGTDANNTEVVTVRRPTIPILNTPVASGKMLKLSWINAKTDLDVRTYQVQSGTGTVDTWNEAGKVTEVDDTIELTGLVTPNAAGIATKYMIQATDVDNNVSFTNQTGAFVNFTVAPPTSPTVSCSRIENDLVRLELGGTKGTFDIGSYSVVYDDATYEGGTVVSDSATANVVHAEAFTGTSRTYFMKARDVNGNTSVASAQCTVTIQMPAQTNFTGTATFEQGNVVLKWTKPTKPTYGYEIAGFIIKHSGTGWNDATDVAEVSANETQLYIPVTESWGITNQRVFKICAKDTRGNVSSTYGSITATIVIPKTPINTGYKFGNNTIELRWQEDLSPTTPSLPLKHFIVNETNIAGALVYEAKASSVTLEFKTFGQVYVVRAVDVAGNTSTGVATITTTLVPFSAVVLDKNSLTTTINKKTGQMTVSWAFDPSTYFVSGNPKFKHFEIRRTNSTGSDWSTGGKLAETGIGQALIPLWSMPVGDVNENFYITIAAKADMNKLVDASAYGTKVTSNLIEYLAPAAVSNIVSKIVFTKIELTWAEPTATLAIKEYEVKWFSGALSGTQATRNTQFSTAIEVGHDLGGGVTLTGTLLVSALSDRVPIDWVDTSRNFYIRATDANGNKGDVSLAKNVVINTPNAPTISVPNSSVGGVLMDQYKVSWTPPVEPATPSTVSDTRISIKGYILGYVGGSSTVTASALSYVEKAEWSGTRTFWVKSVDLNDNTSTATASVALTVNPPLTPVITAQVVDNNVLLYWTDAKNTLPIKAYNLRRENTDYPGSWDNAHVIGDKSGGFTTILETEAGNYKYFMKGIDSAGNFGPMAEYVVNVNQPPDYLMNANWDASIKPIWYKFSTGSTITDWTATNCVLTATGSSMKIASNANDPMISTTTSFSGKRYSRIFIGIKRVAGTAWSGQVYFQTSGHGYSASYYKDIAEPGGAGQFITAGETAVLDIDMSTLTVGGTNWVDNTITGLRFDFGGNAASNDQFEIEYIRLEFPKSWNTSPDTDDTLLMGTSAEETYAEHFTTYRLRSVAISNGGTGYAVGDVVTLGTQSPDIPARVQILTVSSGVVTSVVDTHPGDYPTALGSTTVAGGTTLAPTVVGTAVATTLYSSTVAGSTAAGLTLTPTSIKWISPSMQVSEGYPYVLEPFNSPAYFEEVFDYGTNLAATKIDLIENITNLAGIPVKTYTISIMEEGGSSYTDYVGYTSVYATVFRYVKVALSVTDGMLKLKQLTIKLDSKIRNDAGSTVLTLGGAHAQGNLAPDYSKLWIPGSLPSTVYYTPIGDAGENSIDTATTVSTLVEPVWIATNTDVTATNSDGGFKSAVVSVDLNKPVLMACFIKKLRTEGTVGLHVLPYSASDANTKENFGGTVVSTSSYNSTATLDTWFLMVGYLHEAGYSGATTGLSGLWSTSTYAHNRDSATPSNVGIDYRMGATTTKAAIQPFAYSDTSTTNTPLIYFSRPVILECQQTASLTVKKQEIIDKINYLIKCAKAPGSQVYFNVPFIDVSSIVGTPVSNTTPTIPIVDFYDIPTPTRFNVFNYDIAGALQPGTVSWSARGY